MPQLKQSQSGTFSRLCVCLYVYVCELSLVNYFATLHAQRKAAAAAAAQSGKEGVNPGAKRFKALLLVVVDDDDCNPVCKLCAA